MKFPGQNQQSRLSLKAVAAGAALAGGLTWLFFTDKGIQTRRGWKAALKNKSINSLADLVSNKTGINKSLTQPAAEMVIE